MANLSGASNSASGGPGRINAPSGFRRSDGFGGSWRPVFLLLPLVLFVLLLNPAGFLGGGSDDWQYLNAARCWATQGPCTPYDHWSARWPVIAPLALAIELFGVSRTAVSIPPLLYAIAALALFVIVVRRWFGEAPAVIAGAFLMLTPVFALRMLMPNADIPELAFLLGAVAAAQAAFDTGKAKWAFVAGLCLALAVQTRETSLAVLPLAGLAALFVPPRLWPLFIWAGSGFLAPLLIEGAVLWAATGDPLHRYALALNHTAIPSTALPEKFQGQGLPLGNRNLIANWEPVNGIQVHWTVDPWLNVFTHRFAASTVFLALILLPLSFRVVDRKERAILFSALAFAGALAALLVYVLAIHPTARMFLPLLAAFAMVTGVVGYRAWVVYRTPVITALLVSGALFGAIQIAGSLNTRSTEAAAAEWIDQAGQPVFTDETTRRALALLPQASRLRSVPEPDGVFYLRFRLIDRDCAFDKPAGYIVEKRHRVREATAAAAALRAMLNARTGGPSLCLYRKSIA